MALLLLVSIPTAMKYARHEQLKREEEDEENAKDTAEGETIAA